MPKCLGTDFASVLNASKLSGTKWNLLAAFFFFYEIFGRPAFYI